MKKVKLIPPDRKQCQCLKPNGNTFMTFGGIPGRVQCTNKPCVIVKELKPAKDGLKGSMSLCAECFEVFGKDMNVVDYKVVKLRTPNTEE